MKKSKKLVLAGLVLLAAITMVLLPLAGCKTEVDTSSPQQEQTKDTNDNAGTGDNDSTNTEDNTSGGGDSGTGGGDTGDNPSTGNDGENGTVPETPAAKLVSISVTTPPTRTVYSVGQSFDPTDMVVTATYDDGDERPVTGTITTDTGTLTQSAGIGKTVTVSYKEGDATKEATFTIDVASYKFTETVEDYEYTAGETGTMTGGIYKKFGDWPQTIKEERVEIGAGTLVRGGLTYHVGSDGNYYVEQKEKANGSGTEYKYSNGDQAGQGGTSAKWFKVEPIVWRVLTEDYKDPDGNSTGNALLLAEKILTGGIPYYDVGGTDRTVDGATIYPNNYEHSAVRAWLNGLEYLYKEDDNTAQTTEQKYLAVGFLQTAFTAYAQSLIAGTSVDNSAASTNPASNPKEWEEGENRFASDTPTTDKVFLLSEKEATTGAYLKDKGITDEDYGFDEYSESGKGNTRIRVTTDYAKATGAYQSSTEGYGGRWWLRSPLYYLAYRRARGINDDGNANYYDFHYVYYTNGGVVPALSISLQ